MIKKICLVSLAFFSLSLESAVAQTSTPTPTNTATPTPTWTNTPTRTITPTPKLKYRLGGIQASDSAGVFIQNSTGQTVATLGQGGLNMNLNGDLQLGGGGFFVRANRIKPVTNGGAIILYAHNDAGDVSFILNRPSPTTGRVNSFAMDGGDVNAASTRFYYDSSDLRFGGRYGTQFIIDSNNVFNSGQKSWIFASNSWTSYTEWWEFNELGWIEFQNDSNLRLNVDTTTNQFRFGTSVDNSKVVLDTDQGDVIMKGRINFGAGSALTITTNAVTITGTRHSLTSGSATDTLNTINGGTSGDKLILTGTAGKTLTVADGAGNIQCGSNRTLAATNDIMELFFDGTNWLMLNYQQN